MRNTPTSLARSPKPSVLWFKRAACTRNPILKLTPNPTAPSPRLQSWVASRPFCPASSSGPAPEGFDFPTFVVGTGGGLILQSVGFTVSLSLSLCNWLCSGGSLGYVPRASPSTCEFAQPRHATAQVGRVLALQ